jgi:hypothetical protein
MAAANDAGAQKIATVFKPLLDVAIKEIKEYTGSQFQEVLLAVGKLDGRIDILEKLVGEKKKATTRGEKKTAGTDAPVIAGAAGDVQVQQPAGATKNFPVNKLVYFRDQFKNNADYRDKYVSAELKALMDNEVSITSKTGTQKLIAQATFCWNYFKNHKTDVADAIEKEYTEAKAEHGNAARPKQQTVEPRSPTPGNADDSTAPGDTD